jgi:hypothetical protein
MILCILGIGRWQRELCTACFALNIIIKEISIQQCLKNTAKVNHEMMLVIWLVVTSVDPIQNVQEPVRSHEKDKISSQVLNLPVPLQNNQLRQDSNALQENREQPQQVQDIDLELSLEAMRDERDNCTRQYSESDVEERILSFIVA